MNFSHACADICEPVLEIGAQWIHGQKGNSVFEICKAEAARDDTMRNLLDLTGSNYFDRFYHWHQLNEQQNGKYHLFTISDQHFIIAVCIINNYEITPLQNTWENLVRFMRRCMTNRSHYPK